MRTRSSLTHLARLFWLPATALLLASCAGSNTNWNMSSLTGPSETPPAYTAEQLAGRYGLAAYQREEDRTRTEAEARQQCRQPYEITRGPSGGLVMHLADETQPQELRLKGAAGKTYIGPEGEAGGEQDREVVSFDGRVLVTRWVSTEIASRYGTAVYVRCEGAPPRTARKKATKAQTKAAPAQQAPVFMAPPNNN